MGKDVGRGLQSRAGCPHADPTGGTRLLQVVQWKDGQVTCLHIFLCYSKLVSKLVVPICFPSGSA